MVTDSSQNQPSSPKGIQVQESAYELSIIREAPFIVKVITVILASVWSIVMLNKLTNISPDASPGDYAVPAIFVLVGCLLDYIALTALFNKTIITVDKNGFSVKQKPIPGIVGDKIINRIDVKQLYVDKIVASTAKNGRAANLYVVKTIDKNNRSTDIIQVESLDAARYIEQKIELFWGIENCPVPGEVHGE